MSSGKGQGAGSLNIEKLKDAGLYVLKQTLKMLWNRTMRNYINDDIVNYERYLQRDRKAQKGIGFLLFDNILDWLIENAIL